MSNLPATTNAQALATFDEQPLDQNPAAVYLASLAQGSRPAMTRALNRIAGALGLPDPNEGLQPRDSGRVADERYLAIPWHAVRFQHAAAIRAKLLDSDYAFSTVNKMLSALRGTLRAAWKLGQMTAEDYHKAASVENVKGTRAPAGRAVAMGELVALLDTCDQTTTGIRDAAIISLLYGLGLRRAELVGLDLGDYDAVEGTLRVRGKRNKERLLPVVNGPADALADWLEVRGYRAGALFWGTGNRNQGGKLTTQAVYKMLQTRAKAAGVADLSPHDFRRTFVSDLLERGADVATVQKLAGHANVQTTASYDRRGEKAKRKAAELLHVPYRRRTLGGRTQSATGNDYADVSELTRGLYQWLFQFHYDDELAVMEALDNQKDEHPEFDDMAGHLPSPRHKRDIYAAIGDVLGELRRQKGA